MFCIIKEDINACEIACPIATVSPTEKRYTFSKLNEISKCNIKAFDVISSISFIGMHARLFAGNPLNRILKNTPDYHENIIEIVIYREWK